jgi:hypothetical protein
MIARSRRSCLPAAAHVWDVLSAAIVWPTLLPDLPHPLRGQSRGALLDPGYDRVRA